MKKLKWIFLTIVFMLTLLVFHRHLHPFFQSDIPRSSESSQSAGTWDFHASLNGKDAVSCTYDIPDHMNAKAGIIYLKSTWKNCAVSVDGKILYTHSNRMNDGFVHLINLPESLGDHVTVYFFDVTEKYQKNLQDLQLRIGTPNDISLFLLRKNMYAILFGCITLLLSATALITALFLRKALPHEIFRGIIWLGIYILLANIWVVTDSSLLLLITGNTYMIHFISFVSFFLMPFSMLELTSRLIPDTGKTFLLLENLNLLMLLLYLVNTFFLWIPTVVPLISIHLLIIITMMVSLVYGFRGIQKKKSKKLLRVLAGYICLFLSTAISLLLFYHSNNLQYSQVYILGMSAYIFFLADSVAISVYDLIKEHANTDIYAKLAYTDLMTNLANRTAFIRDQENDRNFAGSIGYIMIDANGLKQVNDTFGHEQGDEFITQIAECIRTVFDRYGTCYRIGGDEFVICIKKTTQQAIENLMDDLIKEFEKRNVSRQIKLSAAVGYAFSETPVSDLEKLLRQADNAMYSDKAKNKSACHSSSRSSN